MPDALGPIRRAAARHRGVTLALTSFKEALSVESDDVTAREAESVEDRPSDRLPTLRESEERLVAEALRRADGNQGVAATLLGLSRQALDKRLSRRRERDR